MPRQPTDDQPPVSIAAVIAAIIREAEPLVKGEKNDYAGYTYVPVDDYYHILGKLAARHGLVLVSREVECRLVDVEAPSERRGGAGKPSLRTFAMTTYACDAYCGPLEARDLSRTTVCHPVTGPQTSGSSMSYAEKVFMRVIFKAVTGEEDADAVEPYRSVQRGPDRDDRRDDRRDREDRRDDRRDDRREDRRDHDDRRDHRQEDRREARDDQRYGNGHDDRADRDESMEEENRRDDQREPDDDGVSRYIKSMDNGLPTMARDTPPPVMLTVFRSYLPNVETMQALRSWWEANDASLTNLHQVNAADYNTVMGQFKARRNQLEPRGT